MLATAYHEAGHAVAHVALDRAFRYVTIEPEQDKLGSCMAYKSRDGFRPDIEVDTKTRLRIEKQIKIFEAGAIAEKKFTGRTNRTGAQRDHNLSLDLALYAFPDPKDARLYLALMHRQAEKLILHDRWWPVVEAVAKALIVKKRLSSQEVREISARTLSEILDRRQASRKTA